MAHPIKYDSITSLDSDEPTELDRLYLGRLQTDEELRRLKQELRGYQIGTAMLTLAFLFISSFLVFSHFQPHPQAPSILLGNDASGFVPAGEFPLLPFPSEIIAPVIGNNTCTLG